MPIRADRFPEPVWPTCRALLPELLAVIALQPLHATVRALCRKVLGSVAPHVIVTAIGALVPDLLAAIAPELDRVTVCASLPVLLRALAPPILALQRKVLGSVAPHVIVTTFRALVPELLAAIAPQLLRAPFPVLLRVPAPQVLRALLPVLLRVLAPQLLRAPFRPLLPELVRAVVPKLILMANAELVGPWAVRNPIRSIRSAVAELALVLPVIARLILAIARVGSIKRPGLWPVIRLAVIGLAVIGLPVIRAGSFATAGLTRLARPLTALLVGPGRRVRVGTGWLRAWAAVWPVAVTLGVLALLLAEISRGLPVRPTPLGLSGIPVGRSEHGRPDRSQIAQPVLGRRLLEIGLRPFVSGSPAEFHPCRHSATRHHHQHQDKSPRSYAVA